MLDFRAKTCQTTPSWGPIAQHFWGIGFGVFSRHVSRVGFQVEPYVYTTRLFLRGLLDMDFLGTCVLDATNWARVHFEVSSGRDAHFVMAIDFWESMYYCHGGQRMVVANL